jgi:hypothetical protein
MPVRIAEDRARQRCTSALAASPVIHLLSPFCRPIRPSRLTAFFTRTHGRPVFILLRKPGLSSPACKTIRPLSTLIPASRSFCRPLPATRSLGSSAGTTTRAIPASIRASVHGGVRP